MLFEVLGTFMWFSSFFLLSCGGLLLAVHGNAQYDRVTKIELFDVSVVSMIIHMQEEHRVVILSPMGIGWMSGW